MHRRLRLDIMESQDMIVLEYFFARNLAAQDFSKDVIRIISHVISSSVSFISIEKKSRKRKLRDCVPQFSDIPPEISDQKAVVKALLSRVISPTLP